MIITASAASNIAEVKQIMAKVKTIIAKFKQIIAKVRPIIAKVKQNIAKQSSNKRNLVGTCADNLAPEPMVSKSIHFQLQQSDLC